jgi:Ca2+-binding RTX toxin-like protein
MSGGASGDALFGDDGNDTLDGGSGRDFLSGGFGDDTVRAVDGEADVVDCGFGLDTVYADAVDMVSPTCENIIRS